MRIEWRIVAASIGGAGALHGMLRSPFAIKDWILLATLRGGFPSLLDLTALGTEAASVLLAILGAVGVGLLLARGGRAGAYSMLAAGAGIAVVFAARPFLEYLAVSGPVRPAAPVVFPTIPFLVFALVPAVMLLVAGTLALVTSRTRSSMA